MVDQAEKNSITTNLVLNLGPRLATEYKAVSCLYHLDCHSFFQVRLGFPMDLQTTASFSWRKWQFWRLGYKIISPLSSFLSPTSSPPKLYPKSPRIAYSELTTLCEVLKLLCFSLFSELHFPEFPGSKE